LFFLFPKLDGFVKSDLFRRGGIFAESNSKNLRIVISSSSEKSLTIKIPRRWRSSE